MVDKTTADWRDVQTLVELLKQRKHIKDLCMDVACMSHVKFPTNGKNESMHNLRKNYRTWLLKTAFKEYKKFDKNN